MSKDKDKDKAYRKARKQKARTAERSVRERRTKLENKKWDDIRRQGPYIKTFLRNRGCALPFYDYIDSYPAEFRKISDWALANHPTLLAIREVSDDVLDSPENHWDELGCANFTRLYFSMDGDRGDYGGKSGDANFSGNTTAFHDDEMNVRTLILLKQSIEMDVPNDDYKYVMKIASLCHEIGHVDDIERGINFKLTEGVDRTSGERTDIIEAEAYAHLFAFDVMAQRGLTKSYELLLDALRRHVGADDYLGKIADKVVSRLPKHDLIDWQVLLNNPPPTREEMLALGPGAASAFGY